MWIGKKVSCAIDSSEVDGLCPSPFNRRARGVENFIEQNTRRPSFHKVRTNQRRHATVLRAQLAAGYYVAPREARFFYFLKDVCQASGRSERASASKALRAAVRGPPPRDS